MHTSGLAADRGNTVSAIFLFGAPTMIVSAAELMIMLLYKYYFIVSPKKMITRSARATWGRRKKEITSTHTDTVVKQQRPW
jgi:hypothetical protein